MSAYGEENQTVVSVVVNILPVDWNNYENILSCEMLCLLQPVRLNYFYLCNIQLKPFLANNAAFEIDLI